MRRFVAFACLFGFLFSGLAVAQIGMSSLVGRLTDSSGAVIPGVTVTVVHVETNFRFNATSNEEGLFRIQGLQPGKYRVTFEAAGFKRIVRESVELRTGDTVRADAALEVGDVAEVIQVTGDQPLLETETSSTGTVMKGTTLYTLPMYQRFTNSILLLVPGTNTRGYASGASLAAFHVAGQRNSATAQFVDGVIGNDQTGGTGTVRIVQNSIAEIKVYTTTLPAEFGHSASGVISVAKKTGTNELHGMASMFGRTRRMQHKNFFDVQSSSDPRPNAPDGVMTLFMMPDANLGGPVVIPKLYNGRDKTFFFVSFERLLDKQVKQFQGQVPSLAMKAGDFSFGGVGNPIFDPATTRQLADGTWTRDAFARNMVPRERFDPVMRRILEIDPWSAPNWPGSVNANGPVSNLLYDRKGQATWNDFSGRLDHQFRPTFIVHGSYSLNEGGGPGWSRNIRIRDFDGNNGIQNESLVQNYSVGNTWVLSPSLISSTRGAYQRRWSERSVSSWKKNYGQILGIPNISDELLPAFGTGDEFGVSSIYGLIPRGPSDELGETFSFQTDVTKVRGTHALKTGYQFMRLRYNSSTENIPSGRFLFDNMTAGLQANGTPRPNTGNTFAGFLLGHVRQAQFDRELATWQPHANIHSFFIQDDWKVRPSLTLNIGLRYTNESPYDTQNGKMTSFDPTAIDSLTGRVGAIIHPGSPLNSRDNNNFQPRFGLAWNPLKRWVFRGGFGLNTIDVKFPLARGNFQEYVAEANYERLPGDPRPIYRISEVPAPVAFAVRPDGTAPFVGANFGSRNAQWWDPALRNPYAMNWNFTTQFQAATNYVIELMYQGSAGVGLVEQWQTNTFGVDFGKDNPDLRAAAFRAPQNFRPFAHFGDILMRSNFGHSTYHSGTVKVDKRYSQGLTFLSYYTFSKAINSQDTDNSGTGVAPIQNRSLEKARAGYDRTHIFMSSITYELPLGRSHRFLNRGGAIDAVFGGWEIAWIQTFQSGNPLTFTFAGSPFNYYPTFVGDRRPNIVSRPFVRDDWRDFGSDRFNAANINPIIDIRHFAYPDAFTPGNAGRNIVTGTPLIWTTASLQKNLTMSERVRMQLRMDFNNPFKTWNFNPPNTTVNLLTPQTFGKVTSGPETAGFGGAPLMNASIKVFF